MPPNEIPFLLSLFEGKHTLKLEAKHILPGLDLGDFYERLMKKDGLAEKAREIIDDLKFDFNCQYDEKDSIGKRYRRQDAIGTPYCITVDYETIETNTVTLRNRDTMAQERVNVEDLKSILGNSAGMSALLSAIA